MLTTIEGLIASLREVGVPISTTEGIDAARSIAHLDLLDRENVRSGLGATLVKTQEHRAVFDTVFDLYFTSPAAATAGDVSPEEPDASGSASGVAARIGALDDEALREMVVRVLHTDDDLGLQVATAELVNRHAPIQPGQPVAGTFHVFRTLRAADPTEITRRLLELDPVDEQSPAVDLQRRLAQDAADARIERLRQAIEAEVRRRLVADRGATAVARSLRSTLPEDVDFLTASTEEISELQSVLAPLPAQLASKVAARRRHGRHGPLDFRRTMRNSMSHGGVPAEPAFHKPSPPKPELFVLADISGSVSTFARFTLQLAHAMRTQFRVVRSFVFIDGMDEVTDILASAPDIVVAAERIDETRAGLHLDGRSDYGNAFAMFQKRYSAQVSSRTIVLVLGDGRSNYRAPRAEALGAISRRAAHLYWLNPEAEVAWGDGDSVMPLYAPHCDSVHECRNIRQLKTFVSTLE